MHESIPQTTARKAKSKTIRVCLLGAEGAGKTCFLAGLAILSDPNRATPLTVIPRDENSASYLDELANTLLRRQWPPPTNMTNLLLVNVAIDAISVDLLVVDYPGEDFREALGKLRQEEFETLYQHYSTSDAILLLFDPNIDLLDPDDAAAKQQRIDRQAAHLRAIDKVWDETHGGVPSRAGKRTDVAIVLTKSDTVSGLGNGLSAKQYFREHARDLDRKIRERARSVRYFAISAIGDSGSSETNEGETPPLQREPVPTGYDKLFSWLTHGRHFRRKVTTWCFWIGILLAIVLGVYVYSTDRTNQALSVLDDENLLVGERLTETRGASNAQVLQRRNKLLKERLDDLGSSLRSAENPLELDDIEADLKALKNAGAGILAGDIEDLLKETMDRRRDILFQQIEDAKTQESDESLIELATKYLNEFPSSQKSVTVRKWRDEALGNRLLKARSRIKQMAVHDAKSLEAKGKRIAEFLREFGGRLVDPEREEMGQAANLARKFSQRQTYTITLKRSGGFKKTRWQGVWLLVNTKVIKEYDSPDASKIVTWPGNTLKFQWKAGEPVKIVLRDRNYKDEDVAWMEDKGPVALELLVRKQVLTQFATGWQSLCNNPFIEFSLADISASDWKAVAAYLIPGDAW